MDTFLASTFGSFVMTVFHGSFTAPSWHSFTYLAYGWALVCGRQTITSYLWTSGAAHVKHFSRYSTFLGRTLYQLPGAPLGLCHPLWSFTRPCRDADCHPSR